MRELEVPYTRISVPVYQIVFEERKEKNPCSLCAKLRRGTLNTALNDLGISKIALGHHFDDAVETMLMNLLFEGRIGCFQPVTYLDRSGIAQIRPLLYCHEDEVRRAVAKLQLPVVQNPCPANGSTRRQEVKELLLRLEEQYPNLRQKIFGAMSCIRCMGGIWRRWRSRDGGLKRKIRIATGAGYPRNDTLQGVQYRRAG